MPQQGWHLSTALCCADPRNKSNKSKRDKEGESVLTSPIQHAQRLRACIPTRADKHSLRCSCPEIAPSCPWEGFARSQPAEQQDKHRGKAREPE